MIDDTRTHTDPHPSRTTSPGRRVALLGTLAALALVLGYVEMLVPLPGAPMGVKLGLGNMVVLFALMRFDVRTALSLMIVKVAGSALLFGNPQVFAFSLAGGLLSWAVMALAVRSGAFSCVGTSVLGGVSHDAGQLIMVALLLSPQVALVNIPLLAVAGVVSGLVVGALTQALLNAIKPEVIHG